MIKGGSALKPVCRCAGESLAERALLAYGGRIRPAKPSSFERALEFLRISVLTPWYVFAWAFFVARIVYLVLSVWIERWTRTPSRPHHASDISNRIKRILRVT